MTARYRQSLLGVEVDGARAAGKGSFLIVAANAHGASVK